MVDTHAEAHRLHRAGLPITLSRAGEKRPLGEGWSASQPGKAWQKKRWTLKEIDQAYKVCGDLNPGVLYGPRSGLADIECDHGEDEGEAAVLDLFDGDVPLAPTFRSKRGPHRIVKFDDDLDRIGKATVNFGALEIKLGCSGLASHSLWPPAVTNDKRREWISGLEYSECEPPALSKAAKERLFTRLLNENCRKSAEGRKKEVHVTQKTQISHEITVSSVSSVCHPSNTSFPRPPRAVQNAVEATIPREPGRRHRAIFEFAQHLKAIPELAAAAPDELRTYVEWWHELSLPVITTKAFEETWFDFRNSWTAVKYSAGEEPISIMYANAMTKPLPKCAERYSQPQLQALVALCRVLQEDAGADTFFLAGRTAAIQLGVEHRTAARWLKMLCMDGILRLDEQGSRHRASEYHYLGD